MTVKELIQQLESLKEKEMEVVISAKVNGDWEQVVIDTIEICKSEYGDGKVVELYSENNKIPYGHF